LIAREPVTHRRKNRSASRQKPEPKSRPRQNAKQRPCTTSHLFLSDGHSRHELKTRVYDRENPRPEP